MNKIEGLFSGINYRLSFLFYFFFNKESRKRTPFNELLYHLFSPTLMTIGKKETKLLREDAKFKYYEIAGYNEHFVYPKDSPFFSLAMVLAEARPRHWHFYEIPQTKIKNGDVVVDCGSAEGLFSFKNQFTAKHIYIMEPMPIFLESLDVLFRNRENITIFPYAVGDKCERTYINLYSESSSLNASLNNNGERNQDSLEIDVVTIDSIFYDKSIKIDYLKADIEGFEENMIVGALKTIRESKPKIAITTYHPGQDYKRLIQIILDVVPEYNYLAKGIDFNSGAPVMLHMWCN